MTEVHPPPIRTQSCRTERHALGHVFIPSPSPSSIHQTTGPLPSYSPRLDSLSAKPRPGSPPTGWPQAPGPRPLQPWATGELRAELCLVRRPRPLGLGRCCPVTFSFQSPAVFHTCSNPYSPWAFARAVSPSHLHILKSHLRCPLLREALPCPRTTPKDLSTLWTQNMPH